MDWKTLFLTTDGRIGRKDFWIGVAILIVGNMLIGLAPVVGVLFHLASIYLWVCLSSKRLHDMGHSGWLTAAPYVVWALAIVAAAATGGVAIVSAAVSGAGETVLPAMLGALGLTGLFLFAAFAFGLAFLLWLGLTAPKAGENRYGPPPTALVAGL